MDDTYHTNIFRVRDISGEFRFLLSNVDLSKQYDYKIRNQSRFPICGACSVLSCIEYLRQVEGYSYESFSIIYHYYMSRTVNKHSESMIKFDNLEGVRISSSFKSLILNGVCESTKTIITKEKLNEEPSEETIKYSKSRLLTDDYSIIHDLEININVFKYVLSLLGLPFVISFRTTKAKLQNRDPCIITMDECDINDAYHAVCVVGYDDEEQVIIFQNSYGTSWKYGGFGKLHYSCIVNIVHATTLNRTCVKAEVCEETDYYIDGLAFMDYVNKLEI